MKHEVVAMTGVLLAQEVTQLGVDEVAETWMVKILLSPAPPFEALWVLGSEWSPKWNVDERE
jgi:hypothetical protein